MMSVVIYLGRNLDATELAQKSSFGLQVGQVGSHVVVATGGVAFMSHLTLVSLGIEIIQEL